MTNCREIALLGVKGGKPTFNSKYDNAIYEFPIQGGFQTTLTLQTPSFESSFLPLLEVQDSAESSVLTAVTPELEPGVLFTPTNGDDYPFEVDSSGPVEWNSVYVLTIDKSATFLVSLVSA